ncbi:MAG: hypothetical protein RBU21_00520 [FCB group bacterium]|jgi:hypothetical protein|nr:hypothetical protein [FCB group bacterium]
MYGAYLLAWVLMIPLAIANGVLRQTTYGKHMPEKRAHQVSTLTGIVVFGAYVWAVSVLWPFPSAAMAWRVGLLWTTMTVAFEFAFGHYVAKHSWSRLLTDYNLLKGRVWILFLIWLAATPCVFHRLQAAN